MEATIKKRTDFDRLKESIKEKTDPPTRDERIALWGYVSAFHDVGRISVEELGCLEAMIGLSGEEMDALRM